MISGNLEIDFTTNVAKITNDVSRIKGSVTGAAREMSDAIGQVKSLLGTLGAGISVKEIIDFADRTIDAMAHMKDLSEIAGTTAEAMSKFEAPTRLAGSTLDQTAAAMARMSKAAVEAYDPASRSAQAFTAIGISTKELRTLAPDQLFELIARQLGNYSDGIQKNAVMQQILSRSGAQLSGTMKAIAETTELHATVTQEDADKAKAFQQEVVRLQMASETFWRGIASDWIPALTRLVTTFKEAEQGAGLFKTTLIGLTGIFGGDASTVDNVIDHFATTFKTRMQDMHDAFNSMGSFRDVLLVMMGLPPSTVAAAQLANSSRGGIPGQTFISGRIGRPQPSGGMDEMGLPSFLTGGKPAPNFGSGAALKAANDLNDALARIMATQSGLSADLGKNMALITEGFLSGRLSADEYGKAVDALITQQPAFSAAVKEQMDIEAEYVKQLRAAQQAEVDEINARNQLLDSLKDQEDAMKAEVATFGMSESARKNYLDQLQMEKEIRTALADPNLSDADATKIEAEIRGRHANIEAMNTELEAMQEQAAVWNELGDMAGRFFSDLVMHGKSAFDDLRNMVKQLLADMVSLFAKRWILNLAAGGTMLGSATSALAGGTGSGSIAGSLLNYGSTALGLTSVMGGAASYAGAGMVASGMGVSAVADSMAINAAAGTAATTGVMSGVMSGVTSALASIPVYGWIALAVIAIAAWLGGKGGGPKTGGSFFGSFNSSGAFQGAQAVPGTDNGRFFTPNGSDAQMQQAGQSFATGYVSTVKALGGTASAIVAGLGIDNDPRGTAQSRVSSMLQMGGKTIFSATNVGVDDKAVPAEVQHQMDQMLLAALQNSDLAPAVEKVLHSITDVASATDDQIKAVLAQAQEMAAVVQGLKGINLNLTVEDLQAFAASGETIGQTFQRIAGEITSFDSAFMTDAQKLDVAQKQITDAFGSLGLAIPKSAEEFYNLVHGLDLSTQSGRDAFDALMKVAPAFQSVQQAGVAMTSALTSALSTLGNTGFGRSMTQGTISNAASQFRATHPFAAGWSDAQLVQQLGTISPQDWANYLANDPAGASLITTILTAAASLASSATPAASSFSNSVNNAASAAANLADQLGQAKGSLGDYLTSLLTDKSLSPLSPLEQQEAARQAWVKDLQAAAGGDLGAFGRIQGDTSTLLGIARQNYGSSSTYVDLFKAVFDQNAKLAGVPDYNTRMIDIQTQTHQSMKDAVALLTTVSERVVIVGNKITAAVGDSGNKVAAAISSTWATR